MSWKRNCSNCEHACVCGKTDVEKNEICEHWSGWIPSAAELPKEENNYMIYEYGVLRIAFYSFDLSKVSKVEFGETHRPGFYYWNSSYDGWVPGRPTHWRPVIDKPEG